MHSHSWSPILFFSLYIFATIFSAFTIRALALSLSRAIHTLFYFCYNKNFFPFSFDLFSLAQCCLPHQSNISAVLIIVCIEVRKRIYIPCIYPKCTLTVISFSQHLNESVHNDFCIKFNLMLHRHQRERDWYSMTYRTILYCAICVVLCQYKLRYAVCVCDTVCVSIFFWNKLLNQIV